MALLLSGQVDVITGGSPSTFNLLNRHPDFVVCGSETDFYAFLFSLEGFECFDDGQMRFEHVINRSFLRVAVTQLN